MEIQKQKSTESFLKREKIMEESRLRCSQIYSGLLDFVNTSGKLPTKTEFELMTKELKPKERQKFEKVMIEMNDRQAKILRNL